MQEELDEQDEQRERSESLDVAALLLRKAKLLDKDFDPYRSTECNSTSLSDGYVLCSCI